ncbi:hypothetical protein FOB63_002891 [Clavispora lusitaniae]|uniref:uncharacterized protein n=1 Tax=Clavispora lusitaniae TaxID=36911 RepID=UPI00202C0E16|nr:hypothetical protein FOB63_002891 [Clavispora lusitaniae]
MYVLVRMYSVCTCSYSNCMSIKLRTGCFCAMFFAPSQKPPNSGQARVPPDGNELAEVKKQKEIQTNNQDAGFGREKARTREKELESEKKELELESEPIYASHEKHEGRTEGKSGRSEESHGSECKDTIDESRNTLKQHNDSSYREKHHYAESEISDLDLSGLGDGGVVSADKREIEESQAIGAEKTQSSGSYLQSTTNKEWNAEENPQATLGILEISTSSIPKANTVSILGKIDFGDTLPESKVSKNTPVPGAHGCHGENTLKAEAKAETSHGAIPLPASTIPLPASATTSKPDTISSLSNSANFPASANLSALANSARSNPTANPRSTELANSANFPASANLSALANLSAQTSGNSNSAQCSGSPDVAQADSQAKSSTPLDSPDAGDASNASNAIVGVEGAQAGALRLVRELAASELTFVAGLRLWANLVLDPLAARCRHLGISCAPLLQHRATVLHMARIHQAFCCELEHSTPARAAAALEKLLGDPVYCAYPGTAHAVASLIARRIAPFDTDYASCIGRFLERHQPPHRHLDLSPGSFLSQPISRVARYRLFLLGLVALEPQSQCFSRALEASTGLLARANAAAERDAARARFLVLMDERIDFGRTGFCAAFFGAVRCAAAPEVVWVEAGAFGPRAVFPRRMRLYIHARHFLVTQIKGGAERIRLIVPIRNCQLCPSASKQEGLWTASSRALKILFARGAARHEVLFAGASHHESAEIRRCCGHFSQEPLSPEAEPANDIVIGPRLAQAYGAICVVLEAES